MPDNTQPPTCQLVSFRSAYQEYSDIFGMFGMPVLNIPHRLENQAHNGYLPNKTITELITRWQQNGYITYTVYDHIRHIQETLTGIFTVDNKEFKYILRDFIAEFMMDEICVIYSEEVKLLEETLLHKLIKGTREDLWLRKQKAKFQSNFRLFKRVPNERTGEYGWKSILTNLTDIKLTPEQEAQMKRFSFNDGYFFTRLFKIFATYETEMQTYIRFFKTLHTPIKISGITPDSIDNKLTEILSPNIHIAVTQNDLKDNTHIYNTGLHENMDSLDLSYHVIQTELNDSLARLGLGGDDSTKAERITTGENFRALQPNSSFQQAILLELNNMGEILSVDTPGIKLKFELTLQPDEKGIPTPNDKSNGFSGEDKE